MVEKAIGVEGDDILYVGDHIYTDAGQMQQLCLAAFGCIVASPM